MFQIQVSILNTLIYDSSNLVLRKPSNNNEKNVFNTNSQPYLILYMFTVYINNTQYTTIQ